MKDFLGNWKTTAIGMGMVVLGAVMAGGANFHSFTEAFSDFRVQISIAVGLLGLFSRDASFVAPKLPEIPPQVSVLVTETKQADESKDGK